MLNCKNLLLVAIATVLVACGGNSFTVSTEFSNSKDIDEGSPIYFGNEVVGEVVDVDVNNDMTRVEIALNKEHKDKINAGAAVVVNRLKQGAPLEIYNRGGDDEALQKGQELKGLDSMFQLGAWMVGDSIQLGTGSVSEYVDAFQEYLNGEKFQNDKQVIQEQIGQATAAAQGAIKSVEKDVSRVVEDLAKAEGPASEAIEQLGEELSPLVAELAKNGSTIMQELAKLTEGLKKTGDDGEKKAGESFLETLLATLEKLNNSMQQGLEQGEAEKEAAEN